MFLINIILQSEYILQLTNIIIYDFLRFLKIINNIRFYDNKENISYFFILHIYI